MVFWCLGFPPKNEQKQVDLRYHSSKVEFARSFFGGIEDTTICFRDYLTFNLISPNLEAIFEQFDYSLV